MLKLFRLTIRKTIYVISEDADAIDAFTAHEMAEEDGAGWTTSAREVDGIDAVPSGDRDVNPHSDDPEISRQCPTIREFFEESAEREAEELWKKIASLVAEGRIVIDNPDHYRKVGEFAKGSKQSKNLAEAILRAYGSGTFFGKPSKLQLYYDFAPASFGFTIVGGNGDALMSGGILYHGPHDGWGSGSAPTFSVKLGDREVGWSIHT